MYIKIICLTETYVITKQNTRNITCLIITSCFEFHREVDDIKISLSVMFYRGPQAKPSLLQLGQDVITCINLNHLERLRINSKKVPL